MLMYNVTPVKWLYTDIGGEFSVVPYFKFSPASAVISCSCLPSKLKKETSS